MTDKSIIPIQRIEKSVFYIREQYVMIDADLAEFYGVKTKRLNEQVKRNIERFPEMFMFRLTKEEWKNLKSQNATASWGGRRSLPYVFTEHGALMLSAILKTEQAIKASILIIETFVKLREIATTHKELIQQIKELEKSTDEKFSVVFDALRSLMDSPHDELPQIGYKRKDEK